eukprot:TRINITY_DN3059_c0_g1_i1.p2 TRINITY_DN3059_c0_g1~~TRINITY_DN3059_c0_g1_i1.p2  ORF type:complete len:343 (-),score=90.75 TRINITY_DN3059_c0_g1_i1:58-1086(-)
MSSLSSSPASLSRSHPSLRVGTGHRSFASSTLSSFSDKVSEVYSRPPPPPPSKKKRSRKVLFNIPGSEPRKLAKVNTLKADCFVLDFEDGVAMNMKQEARKLIPKALSEYEGNSEMAVRVNSASSGLLQADLASLIPVLPYLDAIVLPKTQTVEEIEEIHHFLTSHGSADGSENKRIEIMIAIESARAILNLKELCAAPRVSAVIFASEDYCADIGATRTPEATELLYARSAVVTHAAAFHHHAIDMVCINYKNEPLLQRECVDGVNLGYTGKQAIHPNQIETIAASFRPTEDQVEFARRVLAENDLHQDEGKGAFEVDGKMIDMPMVLQAQRIVSRAGEEL